MTVSIEIEIEGNHTAEEIKLEVELALGAISSEMLDTAEVLEIHLPN